MRLTVFLNNLLTADLAGHSRIKKQAQLILQANYAVVRDLADGQLTMRSMSLSFSSLISMVPMLAFSFSVLKGFGAHNMLEPILQDFLAPMGENGQEVGANILTFVDNMNVAVLGSAGLLVLIFTVTSLVKKIEDSFNYIWHVKHGRGLIEQLRDYLSIILVGPILAVSAAGIATALQQTELVLKIQEIQPLGEFLVGLLRFTPKLIVFAIFAFVYGFIPNVRVSWWAAATGALVATVLGLIASWGFTSFVASSTQYTAIYSSFAVLILFLIWLNLNWLFVLMGANIAYYVQNPAQLLLARGELRPSARLRQRVALQSMLNIARDYESGDIRWNGASLSRKLNIPQEVVELLLQDIVAAGLLVQTSAGQNPCYLPGRSIDRILLTDIVEAVSVAGQNYGNDHLWDTVVLELSGLVDLGVREQLQGGTLAELVRMKPGQGHRADFSPEHE
jgi:membrane protein